MAYLMKAEHCELLQVAKDFGLSADSESDKFTLCNLILNTEFYDEKMVKASLECVREKDRKRREMEWERDKEERARQFELEKLRITSANSVRESSPPVSETSFHRVTPDIKRLMPKFEIDETDISLFLSLFERQATAAQICENEWPTQLMAILPMEIGQIIIRETDEDTRNYTQIKKILLDRYRLSPEAFRKKFVSHTKKPNCRWKDYAYELQNYLDGWVEGLEIGSFEELKELMITDQMKKRACIEAKDRYLDEWGNIKSPFALAEKLDRFEAVRPNRRNPEIATRRDFQVVRSNEPRKRVEMKETSNTRKETQKSPRKTEINEKEHEFNKRKSIRCFECGSESHIRPSCPQWKKKQSERMNQLDLQSSAEKCLEPYMSKAFINGKESLVLRDSGATVDLVTPFYAPKETLTGEVVWIRQPLDHEAKCLPLARVNISGNFGSIMTKAAVIDQSLDQGHYILGNRTFELIQSLNSSENRTEYVNVVTRAQAKAICNRDPLESKLVEESEREGLFEKRDEVPAIRVTEESETGETDFELSEGALTEAGKPLIEYAPEELRKEQQECETLRTIWEKVGKENENIIKQYCVVDGILYRNQNDHSGEKRKLIVVPKVYRDRLLEICHDTWASHLGVTKTRDRLARRYYWPGCYREVEDYVRTCDSCQRAGKSKDKKKAPLKLVPIIREVFSKINIDACGPLPISENGNKYIITAICLASKYPEAVPTRDIGSVAVTDALLQIFSRMGFPKEVQCDQGTSFTSNLTSEFFERFGIKVTHSSVSHPQSNPVERFHRTIKRLLRVLCVESGNSWERHLPAALLALRTVTHDSIGFSPSELIMGKNLRTPEVLLYEHWAQPPEDENVVTAHVFNIINRLKKSQDLAVEKMAEVQVKRKVWYDRNAVKREFKEGDSVLILVPTRPNKLAVHWKGPGVVESKLSETNYVVRLEEGRERSQVYHINMLKPYHQRPEAVNLLICEGTAEEKGQPEWDVPLLYGEPEVFDVEEMIEISGLGKRLTEAEVNQLRVLLVRYSEAFSNTPGVTNQVEHKIALMSEKPIRSRPYRASQRQNDILKKEIETMLRLHVIEIGESDYASPMILVEAPGRDPRPCIDYRKLNAVIRTEFFPLPNIEERVEKVAAARYITVLDLAKGYWQIPLSKEARRIAAFVTTFGSYRPLRMPFGLKNAPYFFSKLMAELLTGCDEYAVPYLDDVAVFSSTWEDHIKHLSEVLERFRKAQLKIKPSKCRFAQDRVKYLGHIVGNGIRAPADAKVRCIQEFPKPTTKTQMRSFLGLTAYYSRYVRNYSEITAPLTNTLKGKAKRGQIIWDEDCDRAFEILKERLSSQPVLHAPDFDREFVVQCDASDVAIGVVLSQRINDEEHPVLYLSKKFSPAEKKYSTIERECAAIIYALKKLRFYLDGRPFLIQTDHQPLTWLNSHSDANQRLLRWSLCMQPFNYRIEHRAGVSNKNADALSRIELD